MKLWKSVLTAGIVTLCLAIAATIVGWMVYYLIVVTENVPGRAVFGVILLMIFLLLTVAYYFEDEEKIYNER